MELSLLLANKILELFLIVLIGMIVVKKGILKSEDGKVLATDSVEMTSKAGFFDKISSFFRLLFGDPVIREK